MLGIGLDVADVDALGAVDVAITDDLSSVAWVKVGGSIAFAPGAAPDGHLDAQAFVEDGLLSTHTAFELNLLAPLTTYTLSMYVKPLGRTKIKLVMGASLVAFSLLVEQAATFDLSAGTAAVTSGAPTTRIVAAANGYWLCQITAKTGPGGLDAEGFRAIGASGLELYTGSSAAAYDIWDVQLLQLPS